MATMLDWGNVEAATNRVRTNLALKDNREAFSLLVVTQILRLDFDEARGAITDGPMDRGIDAVYLDDRFGQRVIHIFQFKHHGSYAGGQKNFPSTEIDKILSFVRDCLGQAEGFLETCNPILRQKALDIWDFIQVGSAHVRVHLCSNGERLVRSEFDRFQIALNRFKFFSVFEHDLDDLSDRIASRIQTDREVSLRMVEEQLFERTDGNVRAVIGTVRADEFIQAFTDPTDSLQLDPALFEENVRVYLGEQNDINRRIYDTAISDEAGLFWYYNNGITIVCDSFAYQPGFRNPHMTLKSPQVVNGGQTSHALFEASKVDFDALRRVRLLVRIIETKDKSLYAKVAEATNSQTPIRSRDLRSNDPVLIRLEASLEALGWRFDRKRDQHADHPEAERIDALKLGQIWLSYVRGEPDKAKTSSDRIFGEYFTLIFDPSEMSADRVISVWKLYLALEERRRDALQKSRSTRGHANTIIEAYWLVEGIYHLAYAVKRIAERKGIDVFDVERSISLIGGAEKKITRFVEERPGISFYRLFRTSATKEGLFNSLFESEQLQLI